jgi:hypothetical protein
MSILKTVPGVGHLPPEATGCGVDFLIDDSSFLDQSKYDLPEPTYLGPPGKQQQQGTSGSHPFFEKDGRSSKEFGEVRLN